MSSEVITVNDMKALLGARPQLFLPQVTGGKVGEIIMFSGSDEPQDWLFCDGRAISRQTFAELFSVIGTTYGVGDGSTTFNIPDFKGRFPVGVGAISPGDTTAESYWGGATAGSVNVPLGQRAGEAWHTLTTSQLPAHTHGSKSLTGSFIGRKMSAGDVSHWGSGIVTVSEGSTTSVTSVTSSGNTYAGDVVTVNATHEHNSVGSGTAHNNMAPFIGINFIICFKARSAGEGGAGSVDKITAGEIDYITSL